MDQHTRPVMTAGMEPVHIEIRHVGKPRQRMPVACMEGQKGPPESIKREATLYVLVDGYIQTIIVDEIKGSHRPV